MTQLSTPDITPAQIVAVLVALVGQLVARGLIGNDTGAVVAQIAALAVPLVWMIADAVIRHGRAKVAAAQVQADATVKVLEKQGL